MSVVQWIKAVLPIGGVISFWVGMYKFEWNHRITINGTVNTHAKGKAVVKITNPVQLETLTDNNGKFKFSIKDIGADTFRFVISYKENSAIDTIEDRFVREKEENFFTFSLPEVGNIAKGGIGPKGTKNESESNRSSGSNGPKGPIAHKGSPIEERVKFWIQKTRGVSSQVSISIRYTPSESMPGLITAILSASITTMEPASGKTLDMFTRTERHNGTSNESASEAAEEDLYAFLKSKIGRDSISTL